MRILSAVFLCLTTPVWAQVVSFEVPPVGVTRVNNAIIFSQRTFDAPTVSGEPDGPVRISTTQGVLTLPGAAGLEFQAGDGDNDAEMVFTGSRDAVNAALDGLRLNPPMDFAGRATINLSADGQDASWHVSVNRAFNAGAARNALLADVRSIHSGQSPGYMVAFGPTAHDVAFYADGASEGPVIAAAGWGRGLVIAMPDHQMLNMHQYGEASGTFYRNGIAWLGGDGFEVRIVTLSDAAAGWLRDQGYLNVVVSAEADLADALADADVFIPPWLGSNPSEAALETIGSFVRGGGGLFICDYGVGYQWWWRRPIHQAPGNQLLREAGIGFAGGSRGDRGVIEITRTRGRVDAEDAVGVLVDAAGAEPDVLDRAGGVLTRMYQALAPSDPWIQRLNVAFGDAVNRVVATPESRVSSAWDKALLERELSILRALEPEAIEAHRSAAAIFGAVPDDAPRVRRVVRIDPAQTRWHSTGLYGAPGEVVRVTVPAAVTEAGFLLRFGGHTDNIARRDTWLRPAEVHWSWPLDADEIVGASPYGGALYIDVGTESRDLAPFDVVIDGAVEAPYFVLGETTDEAWIAGLRDAPAPYAEMVSDTLIISLPSNLIRTLDNPTEVMTLWNDVVRLQDELGTHAERRHMAERINIDVQVSVGYLHAGYPTQGPVVSAAHLFDYTHLRSTGSWGWFHELGHEAQRRPDKTWGWDNAYTFDGSVEATVNIFTVYAYDQLGIREQGGWSWTGAADTVMRRALNGLAGGAYAAVGVDVKLAFFLQLRDHFGWPAIREVFERYNAEGADLPQDNAAERDTWLIQVSQVMGHNLGTFMSEAWGLELSDEALAEVADLPDWMPAVGGVSGSFNLQPGQSISFDLSGEALSHDDFAEVVNVTAPETGQLVVEDGVWVYTAAEGISGVDEFSYDVSSSTGHTHTSTIELEISWNGVTMDTWENLPGQTIADLRDAPAFPDNPSESRVINTLESPRDRADNYGVRLRAYLVPPNTDDYTFWLASDDAGELWIGAEDDFAAVERVAHVDEWTAHRAWNANPSQRSEPIALEAGQVYAIEALMKEGAGGDHLSVAWATGNGEPVLIPEAFLFTRAPESAPVDAGVPEPDAGVDLDAGVAPDAAIAEDAAVEIDAVIEEDADVEIDAVIEEDAAVEIDVAIEEDAAIDVDVAIEEDAAVAVDAVAAPDAAIIVDARPPADAMMAVDSAMDPDAAPIPDAATETDAATDTGAAPEDDAALVPDAFITTDAVVEADGSADPDQGAKVDGAQSTDAAGQSDAADDPSADDDTEESGCDCSSTDTSHQGLWFLILLAGLVRRRKTRGMTR